MRFAFNKSNWQTIEQGEKECFLLTNGLGGYCSLSIIGAAARGDQALLMVARKAPNVRWHLVTNVLEKLVINGNEHIITSQRMKSGDDLKGFKYLQEFVYDDIDKNTPRWKYQIEDVTICKTLLMPHGENTVAIKYTLENPSSKSIKLEVTPLIRFSPKKEEFDGTQNLTIESYIKNTDSIQIQNKCHKITHDEYSLYISTDAQLEPLDGQLFGEMYFSQDERDGREKYSGAYINHHIVHNFKKSDTINGETMTIIFSTQPYQCSMGIYEQLADKVSAYKNELINKAALNSELGRQLVLSADAYVVDRESTKGKSIIAGYPFFEDWGRDTMISLAGTTMVTGRFDECKSILRTFAKYVKGGLLPNLFPEGDVEPMYNSVDAPLLFINSAYEYIEYSKDYDFKDEILPVLMQIVDSYRNGTDFHIKMDKDGLISAGDGMEQLTWMDVRVGDFLPTPRHGKPVEINAYWYSTLIIMEKFTGNKKYAELAQKVKSSFNEKFWNEDEQCLKDVLSGNSEENQIRCNQIWALSMPFTMLSPDKERLVIKKIKDELYTTIGLRTLSKRDPNFHGIYIGEMQERDRAYHQGTVWAFPLGAYYRACIKYANKCGDENERASILNEVKEGLESLTPWLSEGCIAQIAEIYDGDTPTVSRGCFAQAWSVGEILRAVYDYEQI